MMGTGDVLQLVEYTEQHRYDEIKAPLHKVTLILYLSSRAR